MTALYKILGYLSVIPFMFVTALLLLDSNDVYQIGEVIYGITQLVYAGFILSFLGGIPWSFALKSKRIVPLVLSVLPTVIVCGFFVLAFFLKNFVISFIGLAVVFIGLYAMDRKFLQDSDFPTGYWALRLQLTIIVCLCLCISACYPLF